MAYYLRLGGVLLIIAAIASGVLAYINGFTQPVIEENRRRAEEEARREVLPEAEVFEFVDADFPFYKAFDSEGDLSGYTFLAQGMGYSGVIQTMVGVNSDFTIKNIKIINQSETPGLGANCVRPEFTDQFGNLSSEELVIDKEGGKIISITGSTITTRAVVNSLREAVSLLQSRVSEKESGEVE